MTVYRMHRSARAAKDCTGAMLAGGRWNSIGTPMLYTAQHLSLACIEVLVHLDKGQLPRDYVWSKAELSTPVEPLAFLDLHQIASCQLAGDQWIRISNELATLVPSVVIPEESNILLNPGHADFEGLRWGDPRPFRFDPRLFVTEPHTL